MKQQLNFKGDSSNIISVISQKVVNLLPKLSFDNGDPFDKKLGLDNIVSVKDYFNKRELIYYYNSIPIDDNDLPIEIKNSLIEAKSALAEIVTKRKWDIGGYYKLNLILGTIELYICTPRTRYHNSIAFEHKAGVGNRPELLLKYDLDKRKTDIMYYYRVGFTNYYPSTINITTITEMSNLLEAIYKNVVLKDTFDLYDF